MNAFAGWDDATSDTLVTILGSHSMSHINSPCWEEVHPDSS